MRAGWTEVCRSPGGDYGEWMRDGAAHVTVLVGRARLGMYWCVMVDAAVVMRGSTMRCRLDSAAEVALEAGEKFCPECGRRVLDGSERRAFSLVAREDVGAGARAAWDRVAERFCSCDEPVLLDLVAS